MMTTRGGRASPARRVSNRGKTCGAHYVAGLQQPFATPVDEVDASHSLTAQAFDRLGSSGSQDYVAGIDGMLSASLKVSDEGEPAGGCALGRNCLVSLKHTAVG